MSERTNNTAAAPACDQVRRKTFGVSGQELRTVTYCAWTFSSLKVGLPPARALPSCMAQMVPCLKSGVNSAHQARMIPYRVRTRSNRRSAFRMEHVFSSASWTNLKYPFMVPGYHILGPQSFAPGISLEGKASAQTLDLYFEIRWRGVDVCRKNGEEQTHVQSLDLIQKCTAHLYNTQDNKLFSPI